jgi:hypothetical protein
MAAGSPEDDQSAGEAEGDLGIILRNRPFQRGDEIVMVDGEKVEPFQLAPAREPRRGSLGQIHVPTSVTLL